MQVAVDQARTSAAGQFDVAGEVRRLTLVTEGWNARRAPAPEAAESAVTSVAVEGEATRVPTAAPEAAAPQPAAPKAAAPAKAGAATSVSADVAPPAASEPHHVRIGREAMSRLRYIDPASMGWKVEFHPGRDGFLGIADWERRTIDIWVRDRHDVQDVLGTLAHEFAHVYDFERWDNGDRDQWRALRGVDFEWWPTCTCDDRGYGAGDIAEAMVVLEAGAGEWTGRFGMPTAAQLDWLAAQL